MRSSHWKLVRFLPGKASKQRHWSALRTGGIGVCGQAGASAFPPRLPPATEEDRLFQETPPRTLASVGTSRRQQIRAHTHLSSRPRVASHALSGPCALASLTASETSLRWPRRIFSPFLLAYSFIYVCSALYCLQKSLSGECTLSCSAR